MGTKNVKITPCRCGHQPKSLRLGGSWVIICKNEWCMLPQLSKIVKEESKEEAAMVWNQRMKRLGAG